MATLVRLPRSSAPLVATFLMVAGMLPGIPVPLGFTLPAATAQETQIPTLTRGPYLQLATPRTVVIRWRTDIPCESRVRYGRTAESLANVARIAGQRTEHSVRLTKLGRDRQYIYSIVTKDGILSGGPDHTFHTPPAIGTASPTRIWVLGDPGTGSSGQMAVRDAYYAYSAGRRTDLWLTLGDNAYDDGTDAEFQEKVFEVYPTTLRQSPLWPALGNHDTAESKNPPLNLPYFRMFTLPTRGQTGGSPSGTEKYYSFNYANIHFVCLDSQASDRTAGGSMSRWLREDLAANRQKWTVAYWHHPVYSKASDSDDSTVSRQMRENLLPILENGGVDLVLAGHSHVYERSCLLDGHYGASSTLTESMKLNPGDGRASGNGAYRKPARRTPHAGAVFVVAGSSGRLANWDNGSSDPVNPEPHPAMITSLRQYGSLVIDVSGPRMEVKFLRETGAVDDEFTILKNLP